MYSPSLVRSIHCLGMIQIFKVGLKEKREKLGFKSIVQKGFESQVWSKAKGFSKFQKLPLSDPKPPSLAKSMAEFYPNSQHCHRIETIGEFPPGKMRRKHSQTGKRRRILCGCPRIRIESGSLRIWRAWTFLGLDQRWELLDWNTRLGFLEPPICYSASLYPIWLGGNLKKVWDQELWFHMMHVLYVGVS